MNQSIKKKKSKTGKWKIITGCDDHFEDWFTPLRSVIILLFPTIKYKFVKILSGISYFKEDCW